MEEWSRRRLVIVAVVGVIVLLGVGVGVRQTIGDDESTAPDDRTGAVSSTPAARSGPTGPGAFDGFERTGAAPDDSGDAPGDAGEGLGVADSGQAWQEASGTWGIDEGRARLVEAERGRFRHVAVVELRTADVDVEVTAAAVRHGSGLVFRYKNDLNYWALSAAPSFATWIVENIEDGEVRAVGNVGIASLSPGTVIGVSLTGTTIEVSVNREVRARFDDPALAGESAAGLLAGGSAPEDARWDNFIATARGPGPTTTDASG